MKVLQVNALYYPDEFGGAERVVKRLADALLAAGLSPEVACLSPKGQAASDVVDSVPVHRARLRSVYQLFPVEQRPTALKPLWHAIDSANPAMAGDFGRLLDRVRPDIVHTHNVTGFSPLIWRTVASRGIPIVHTLHDHYLLCPRATMHVDGRNCDSRHVTCAVYSVVRLSHASRVDAIVGVSRYILARHEMYRAFPRAAVRRVIHNPVSPEGSVPVSPTNTSQVRIGFLGRLDRTKGLAVLLAACESLPESRWTLDVAGVGVPEYEQELRALATSPNVRLLGRVDAAQFLATIDVLVVPSLINDSLPLVIVEAFAAGVPVIGSRLGGIPELIQEGRTGFLVRAGDSAELRALLARLAETPAIAREMRTACRAASDAFAPQAIAREYAEVYRAVMATARRPSR